MRGSWSELSHDVLLSRGALGRGFFGCACLRQLIDKHTTHKRIARTSSGRLMLKVWQRTFIDRRPVRLSDKLTQRAALKVANSNARSR